MYKDWELSNNAVILKNEYGGKEWTFDRVFDENCNSENVYEEVVSPIVSQALEGYNGKFFELFGCTVVGLYTCLYQLQTSLLAICANLLPLF